MSQQNIDYGPARQAVLKLAAQRQLAFDEPVSRLARIKKTTAKQLTGRQKIKDFPFELTAELHGLIFAPEDTSGPSFVASLCLSLAFVLEDFRLYADPAFSAFAMASKGDKTGSSQQNIRTAKILSLAQKLADCLQLAEGRRRWLVLSLLATIDWTALEAEPATSSDANGNKSGDHGGDKNGGDSHLPAALLELVALARRESGRLVVSAASGPSLEKLIESLDVKALLAVAERLSVKIRENFRPSLVVLVEGQSELIVLPHFARLIGQSFESLGALVVASGGAQQVARRYLTMKDVLSIPIVCVFDGDAGDSSILIEEALRDGDRVCSLESGELEDCYSWEQLVKILGRQLAQTGQTLAGEAASIPRQGPRKEALNHLFRSRGLGDFDKIAFAKNTVSLARSKDDVPGEMSRVIASVAQVSHVYGLKQKG